MADKIMVRISTDENLHHVFYRDAVAAAMKIRPSETICAIVDEVLEFKMPGFGIPGFRRKAAEVAKAGIYDIRGHRDEVVMPLLNYWKVFEATGLNAAAEEKRRQLAHHLELLDRSARKAEERRAEEELTASV